MHNATYSVGLCVYARATWAQSNMSKIKADQQGRAKEGTFRLVPRNRMKQLRRVWEQPESPGIIVVFFCWLCEKWTRSPCTRALAKQGFSQTILRLLSVILCLSSSWAYHLFTASPVWRGHPFKWVYLSSSPLPAFLWEHIVWGFSLGVWTSALFLPPSSLSLAASHFHNYSSGLKQRW